MMLRRLIRSWGARVAVEGQQHGPDAASPATGCWSTPTPTPRRRRPRATWCSYPTHANPTRLLVKRVSEVDDRRRHLFVTGDSPDASTDSRSFGSVEATAVEGRPWFRYWPLRRLGRVR